MNEWKEWNHDETKGRKNNEKKGIKIKIKGDENER